MKYCILTIVCLVVMSGCSSSPKAVSSVEFASPMDTDLSGQADPDMADFDELEPELPAQASIGDPIETWNRWMFGFNDGLYFWVLKPVASGYKAIIPEPGRIGIRNVVANIATPVRLVNCALQGKFHAAGNEINRCIINTTWGVAGIWDPAREHGKIELADEDMGQTLAVYGLDNGCYLVWPLFGPSSLRDSAGMGGDYFLDPLHYVKPAEASMGISAVNITNKTSFRIGEYEAFKDAAIDPYIAMRQAYIQYRQKQVEK